jgi:predicted ATPase
MTQEGWALLLGVSAPTVKRWERGAAVPTAEAERVIVDLCRDRGLFRAYISGSISGLTITPQWLAGLLADARIGSAGQPDTASGQPQAAPQTSGPGTQRAWLPVEATDLIGRERELAAVTLLLARGTRLLTLTGPGGSGKTRLALAIAQRAPVGSTDGAYQAGVAFVDLSSLTDPPLVVSTVAQTLGLRELEGQSFAQTLAAHLAGRTLLLVLDNFEHVVEAAVHVRSLLDASPGLTLLVTSRVPLRVQGEREYMVQPLSLPEARQVPDPVALEAVLAVALFIERAQSIQADFALTAENAQTVAEICIRLDGLPLAIELAAVRLRVLSPPALLARLDHRLALLTGGPRDLPARHQTLRGTIAWSYDLLQPEEQALFRSLAVFPGGCTIGAALHVAAATPGAEPDGLWQTPPAVQRDASAELAVLERLGALVAQSLLRKEDGPDGEPRFLMLATVREYALEHLTLAGEAAARRSAYASYFLDLAEGAAGLRGPDSHIWLDRLEREHDNLRAALGWLEQAGDTERALRLVGALWWFWWIRAYVREGRDWLSRALAMGSGSAAARARALEGLGMLHTSSGEIATALPFLEEAVALRRQAGDQPRLMTSLSWLGNALRWSDPHRAHVIHTEVLAFQRANGGGRGVAGALINLGFTALAIGDTARATELLEYVVVTMDPFLDDYRQSIAYIYLALTAIVAGDTARATAWLRRGTPHLRAYRRVAYVFMLVAVLAHPVEQARDAARLFAAVDTAAGNAGDLTLPGPQFPLIRAARLRELQASLDENEFAAAWAEGQQLTFDAAFALVLAGLEQAAGATTHLP